jgi:hypothetical protein
MWGVKMPHVKCLFIGYNFYRRCHQCQNIFLKNESYMKL